MARSPSPARFEHAMAYAIGKGWTADPAHIYQDDGISGAEFVKRPGFLRLMNPRPRFRPAISSQASPSAPCAAAACSPGVGRTGTCDHLISAPGGNTVGITISAPGTYCLATDVIMATSFTSGNGLEIAANYVPST